MAAIRDHYGFINLDEYPIKRKHVINIFNSFSFYLGGKKFFFKELKNSDQCYNELVGYELAKDFGFEAVSYDIAISDGFPGYLSRDYMQPGYVCLEDFYKVYFNYNTRHRCNLDDVSIMLRDTVPEVAEDIINDLVRLLMFDIIIANYDRHDRNIIIDTKRGRLAPVADNEMMLNEDSLDEQYYSFKVMSGEKRTVDNFISYLDMEGLEFFLNKLQIISQSNIESVCERVERKIGYPMIPSLKQHLMDKFQSHYVDLVNKVTKEIETRKVLAKK